MERKLLDYQTHMASIAPHLANGMVIMACVQYSHALGIETDKMIEKGDFSMLEIYHHITSGLKSMATNMHYMGIDEMRKTCGGAGFLQSSGLVGLFQDHAALVTYEGVNVLML